MTPLTIISKYEILRNKPNEKCTKIACGEL